VTKPSGKRKASAKRTNPLMLQVMVDKHMLEAIDKARETSSIPDLSRAQMVRTLLREALRARGVPC
jgi:hypothetical protein